MFFMSYHPHLHKFQTALMDPASLIFSTKHLLWNDTFSLQAAPSPVTSFWPQRIMAVVIIPDAQELGQSDSFAINMLIRIKNKRLRREHKGFRERETAGWKYSDSHVKIKPTTDVWIKGKN